jgi:hypothetical protein
MNELKEHNGNGIRYAIHLSAPKGGSAQMLRDPSGDWVSYEEYSRLKAKVERLTKAGDDILHTLLWTDEYSEDRYKDAEKKWNAAKERKQS